METEASSAPTKKTAAEAADELNGLVTSTAFNKGKPKGLSRSHITQPDQAPRTDKRTDAFAAGLAAMYRILDRDIQPP